MKSISYNTLLANALKDSYLNTIKSMVYRKPDLLNKMQYGTDMDFYVYTNLVLEDIMSNTNEKQELINGITTNLKICQKK